MKYGESKQGSWYLIHSNVYTLLSCHICFSTMCPCGESLSPDSTPGYLLPLPQLPCPRLALVQLCAPAWGRSSACSRFFAHTVPSSWAVAAAPSHASHFLHPRVALSPACWPPQTPCDLSALPPTASPSKPSSSVHLLYNLLIYFIICLPLTRLEVPCYWGCLISVEVTVSAAVLGGREALNELLNERMEYCPVYLCESFQVESRFCGT